MTLRCEGNRAQPCGASVRSDEVRVYGDGFRTHVRPGHARGCEGGPECEMLCPVPIECGPVLTDGERFAEWETQGEPVG